MPTMNTFRAPFAATAFLAAMLLPIASPAADTVKLTATGSSTVGPLVSELARRYTHQHPGVRIDVQLGGSSRGVADARRGMVAMGMASRALKPEEKDLTATTIAHDGVTVIVHASNPIGEIPPDRLKAIYQGKVHDWGAVGGQKGRPLVVVNKAAGRSTLELMAEFLGVEPGAMVGDIIIGDNQQGIKTVAGNPDAVGYVSIGAAEAAIKSGTPIRVLKMNGIEATMANVANGTFPISRPLNVVTRGAPTGEVARFLAFARSPAQDDITTGLYFVPQHVQ